MKRSLKAKLILSYLAVALLTVLVVSAVIRLTSGRSLMNLVVEQQTALLTESVQTYYTANGSLDGFFAYFLQSNRVQPAPDQPVFPTNHPGKATFAGCMAWWMPTTGCSCRPLVIKSGRFYRKTA